MNRRVRAWWKFCNFPGCNRKSSGKPPFRCTEHLNCDECAEKGEPAGPPETRCRHCPDAHIKAAIALNARHPVPHKRTLEVVCPWCGRDSSNGDSEDSEEARVDCSECGHPFTVTRHVKVTYSTAK